MINREQIENILKINGVTPAAPDEQIRSVLLSARYNKDEVDTAIMVLRENIKTSRTRVEGLHKVFHTTEALSASEISQLLGIEVDVSDPVGPQAKGRNFTIAHNIIIAVLSVIVAVAGILLYMHLHQIGVFHNTSEITIQ